MELGKSLGRKITLLLASIAFLGVVNYTEASSSTLEELSTCQPFSEQRVLAASLEAADLVGIDHIPLIGVLMVETRFGNILGEPNEVLSARPNRDMVPLIALARSQGLRPFAVCASKRYKDGYGGALGPAQILPWMFLHFSGLLVKDGDHYRKMGKNTEQLDGGDVALLQKILNRLYPGDTPLLVEDGIIGTKTVQKVRRFQRSYMGEGSDYRQGGRCLPEIRKGHLGTCTRVALLDKVRWVLKPNPEKSDRLTPLLGVGLSSKIPNPWDLRTSVFASALLLKDLGVQENPDQAFGAYFAGPSGAFSEDGVGYARKVREAMGEVPNLFINFLMKN